MARGTRRTSASLIAKVLLCTFGLVGGLVLSLLALEIGLRLFSSPSVTPGYTRTNASRRYELRPGFRGTTLGQPLAINSLGARDFEREVAADAYRIVVLGDSITFGQGVRLEQTFPKLLETKLNAAKIIDRPIQVFNLGIPSYNTTAELIQLRDEFLVYNPNLVIVEYSAGNDSLPLNPDGGRLNRSAIVRFGKDLVRGLYSYDFLATIFYRLLFQATAVTAGGQLNQRFALDEAKYEDSFPGWIEAQSSMAQISTFTKSHGVGLLFALYVNNVSLGVSATEDPMASITTKLYAALRKAEVEHVLLLDDFYRSYRGNERALWVAAEDSHFSPLAHELVASGIFDYLVQNGLVNESARISE